MDTSLGIAAGNGGRRQVQNTVEDAVENAVKKEATEETTEKIAKETFEDVTESTTTKEIKDTSEDLLQKVVDKDDILEDSSIIKGENDNTNFANMMSSEEASRYEKYWKCNAPGYNTPNSKVIYYKENRGVIEKSTVIYDDFGRQKWRVDYNNHGYSDHSIPHLHEYEYSPGYDPLMGKETRYDIWN